MTLALGSLAVVERKLRLAGVDPRLVEEAMCPGHRFVARIRMTGTAGEPALTWSAHDFRDARLDRAVREHLSRETPARAASIEQSMRESPIFKVA